MSAKHIQAKPATIYLGTRSHFRSQRRKEDPRPPAGRHKSFTASLASSYIRRKTTHSAVNTKKILKKKRRLLAANAAASSIKSSDFSSSPSCKTTTTTKEDATADTNNKMSTLMQLPIGSSTNPAGGMAAASSTSSTKVPQCATTTTKTASPSLPSPTGSTSETSDYQRSTPSPIEQDSSLGPLENWPATKSTANAGSLIRRKSTSSLVCNCEGQISSSSKTTSTTAKQHNVVLQQLRVALKKIPEAKLTSFAKQSEAAPESATFKRRHSDVVLPSSTSASSSLLHSPCANGSEAKKMRLSLNNKRPLLSSFRGQGKITEYLAEMKQFTALRKEKLDRVLNLGKRNSTTTTTNSSSAPASGTATPVCDEAAKSSGCTDLLSKHLSETSAKNESSDISSSRSSVSCSPRKSSAEAIMAASSESGLETGSSGNDTASVASSGSRHSVSSGIARDEDIFEVPKTIRFPPAAPTKCYSEVVICKWEMCGLEFDSEGKLLDHLKTVHADVESQKAAAAANGEESDSSDESTGQYKCLWEGCKVYGKGSSSKSWLEKHVINHGGNKPFQCIVDGCKQRFGTQSLLERHVNSHFKYKEDKNGGQASGQTDNSHGSGGSIAMSSSRSSASNHQSNSHPTSTKVRKLVGASGRKVKYRKTIYSARIFDLFDMGSMARVRYRLSQYDNSCQQWKQAGMLESDRLQSDQVVVFTAKSLARRKDQDGNILVLQSWSPENIFENEWVPEKTALPSKRVKMSSLSIRARGKLSGLIFGHPVAPEAKPRRGRKIRPQPRSTALS